ncbi:MAG: hypothetical protein SPL99_04135 [Catonella sp.]|nr:hypothetical protein [Catonella sp.]MDY6355858.1 hypothetical protein [Catonella sp.]
MDKKNKMAGYAAKIRELEKGVSTNPETRDEKLRCKECLEREQKYFIEIGRLYRALIPHIYAKDKRVRYGVEPVNQVEILNGKYSDDGALDTIKKIIPIIKSDTFRRSSAITSIYFSCEMTDDFSGCVNTVSVDGDNIEPSATNQAWGRYRARYDLKKNNVTGVFDSKDTFEDPIPAEIIEIVNASEEENDELTSNIKALLNAKNRGVDLINKNGRGNDTMTRTDLIKNLSK